VGLRNISGNDWFLSFEARPLVDGLVVEKLIVFLLNGTIGNAAFIL